MKFRHKTLLLINLIVITLLTTADPQLLVMNSVLTSMTYFMFLFTIVWLIFPTSMGGDFFILKNDVLWKISKKNVFEYTKTKLELKYGFTILGIVSSIVVCAWLTWLGLRNIDHIGAQYHGVFFSLLVISRTVLWLLIWPVTFIAFTTILGWIISPSWWKDEGEEVQY